MKVGRHAPVYRCKNCVDGGKRAKKTHHPDVYFTLIIYARCPYKEKCVWSVQMMAGKRYLHFIKGDLVFGANFFSSRLKKHRGAVPGALAGTLPLSPHLNYFDIFRKKGRIK
jgi:hypothetical protein